MSIRIVKTNHILFLKRNLTFEQRKKFLILFFLFPFLCLAQTPIPMASQVGLTYTENFADIANWSNAGSIGASFSNGFGATRWTSVGVGTGTIPNATAITTSTTSFQTGSLSGIQKGNLSGNVPGTLVLLTTGTTDNTSACSIDFLMDYSNINADSLFFDAATVFNYTGNRVSSLRVYWSTNGTTFTQLTGTNLPFLATNYFSNSSNIRVKLPSAFNNKSTCRLRFYYHNGTGGITGSRPKISIDNVKVTGLLGSKLGFTDAHPISGNVNPNTTNNIIAGIQIVDSVGDGTLNGITVTTAGTYSSSDIQTNGFKFWLNSSNNLVGATQLGANQAVVASGASISISGLNQLLPIGSTNYLLITVDIASGAFDGNNIGINNIAFSNISLGGAATKLGVDPIATSNLQTILRPPSIINISTTHPLSSFLNTNTSNNILASFQIQDSLYSSVLSGLSFTTQGTYTSSNIQSLGFKCWLNNTNDLVGATQIGTSQSVAASGGVITLSGLSQNIPIGTSYILVTFDISNTAENGNSIGLSSTPLGNFTFTGNTTINGVSNLAPSNVFTINEMGPVKMQYRSNNIYSENFSDIANWTNGFAAGLGAGRWAGVATNVGPIPNGSAITVSTANFQTSSSGAGIQRGSLTGNVAGTLAFLSLGNTDNTSSCAVDFFLDYTRRNADSLVFDAATVFNGVGNRNSSLRVYWSIDGTNFTELTGNNLPYTATNNAANSATIRAKLPTAFNNVSSCRLRFYYHNGTGGTTSSRPKISIDNVQVSAVCPIGTSTANISSCTPYTWNGETYSASGTYYKTLSGANVWGCDSVAILNLSLNPVVTYNPFQDTIKTCGNSYTLNAGSGYVSYVWNTGASSSTISPSNANWYKVTVNNGTCSASDSVLLSIVNANIPYRDTTICLGKSIALIATGSGVLSSPLNYLWSNGGNTQNITVSPTQTTTYYCTVSNGINSCIDSVKVTKDNFNPNLFIQDTLKVCGTSYTLNAGSGYTSYLWNTASTSESINATSAGWKNCTVSNGLCSSKDSVLLSMINANIINNDSTIIAGATITLKATGTGVISTSLSYAWSNGANTQNITVSPTQKTTYYCTVSNGVSSCADSVNIGVNVKINLKMFFEAFYENGRLKSSLNNADGGSDIGLFDTIQVMLFDSLSNALVYNIKAIVDTGGVCQILIPSTFANGRYYVGIKHRGSIETWSSSSILLNHGLYYNFSSSVSKALGDNLINDGTGIYLIYNGDINQDGVVDFNDYPDLDIQSNNGDFGYLPTDLNGDGSVDFNDYPSIDKNSNDGIISFTPSVYNGFIRNKATKKSVFGK